MECQRCVRSLAVAAIWACMLLWLWLGGPLDAAAVSPDVRPLLAHAHQTDSPSATAPSHTPSARAVKGLFPTNSLYQPMLADPKQPRFFASLFQYDSNVNRFTMGSVGFGEYFGIYRWQTGKETGWQTGIQGGVFSQFNMNAPSTDLINTDFTIGPTLSYRSGNWATRFRIYHQSSHLGDEFLLRASPERINLSFESAEWLLSYRFHWVRVYGGGEYLIRKQPDELDPAMVHAGLESRNLAGLGSFGHWVGGVDLKGMEEHNWAVQVSLKTGIQITRPGWTGQRVSVLLEAFKGHSPYGQFYRDRVAFVGAGIFFGL